MPLPGKREDVMAGQHGLELPAGPRPNVVLPAAVTNPEWPQPGGNPAHVMGHLQTADMMK